MKGKLKQLKNNWYIAKISEGDETDTVELVYYPIAFSESRAIELIEGLEVEFITEVVDYIDTDGIGQEHFIWGIIL